jgi:hypothetical protein
LQLWTLWAASNGVKNGDDLCLGEMARGLLVREQEQEEEWVWGVVLEKGGWEETSLEQVPAEAAFAPVVGQKFLMRQVLPATA